MCSEQFDSVSITDTRQLILEKKEKRFKVLFAIYKDTDGKEDKGMELNQLEKATGIPSEELIDILSYLKNEGLIKPLRQLLNGSGFLPIQILHQGVIEVEAAIEKPKEPTKHFPAQVFNIINNAPISSQQLGNQNTVNSAAGSI